MTTDTTPAPVTVERLRELREQAADFPNGQSMLRQEELSTICDELLASRETIARLRSVIAAAHEHGAIGHAYFADSPAVKQATACGDRCGGKRILSYINLSNPFAPAEHRKCPGCPDCGDTEGLVAFDVASAWAKYHKTRWAHGANEAFLVDQRDVFVAGVVAALTRQSDAARGEQENDAVLYDGYAVYKELTNVQRTFVSADAVSAVLDAIVRIQKRATPPAPAGRGRV